MAVNPDEDTEFNDALRKHGILPPREPPRRTPSPPPSPSLDERLDDLTTSELEDLDDHAWDDDTQRIVEQHKRQRLMEERGKLRRARFGRVYPISREEYQREVTDASKLSEEGDKVEKGTGVVCFLYKDGIPRSDRAFQQIKILAERHPGTKFVSIVGDKCIPNLPDSRIPMIIVYKNGEIRNQIVAWGADREHGVEEMRAALVMAGAIEEERCEEDEKRKTPKNKEDSDSDFEFDL